ncbi:MAG: hypothetical protein KJ900_09205 [Proteobacteria bacterium]|nr:hypothetical protein [Pseudomonadota bacterium]MBU4235685.1 hypothetical protein [Pseudomonadota bacterium]
MACAVIVTAGWSLSLTTVIMVAISVLPPVVLEPDLSGVAVSWQFSPRPTP